MDTQEILAAAAEAMRSRSMVEAESDCRSILTMFPRHYRALVLLAEILKEAGRKTEALTAYHCAEMSTPHGASPIALPSFLLNGFEQLFGPAVSPPETIQNKRRVQMRSLGQNGRFGNQLLQYAFVCLYARQATISSRSFPDWIGRDVF